MVSGVAKQGCRWCAKHKAGSAVASGVVQIAEYMFTVF